ncbi:MULTISPECIES: hypothetical protein [Pseudomonas]|uniref:hypothetical protein n=1 Tax=Pseudomonas TaxID=286 RepID=UPI001EFFCFD9|nr:MULTISPECIES: hypothetical protein [Pseudomonas]MCG8295048.1 hypothetical protein [Pseudomonas entomophila]
MRQKLDSLRGLYRVPMARLILISSILLYALSIMLGQECYLSVEHAFWGFNAPSYDPLSIMVMVGLLVLPATSMPLRFNRVSSLFIYALMFFVYVPALVIGTLNRADALDRYFFLFLSFALGVFICSLLVRSGKALPDTSMPPSRLMISIAVVGGLVCFVSLYSVYRDVIYFSGLNEIYAQREKGAATSLFIGYCQVYLAYFFSPILFVYGLLYRKYFLFALGLVGFVFTYMITAERTVILLPVMLWGVARAFRTFGYGVASASGLFLLGALLVTMISLFFQDVGVLSQLGLYIFMRLIAIPGLFVTQYFDLFSEQGFTHWSHVSVIGSMIDVPAAYAADEKWPALGKILAERVLGIESQSNAGFIATDGVAAWGSAGVFLVCMLYSAWLLVLDKVSRGWNRLFLLTALFPLAFISANGSLFTMMTSFGGALWVLLLWVDKYRFRFAGGRVQ